MKFFHDLGKAQPLIERAIQKYGYAPEHNFYWYTYCIEKKERGVWVEFPRGLGLMTIEGERTAYVFSAPVAPPEKRADILLAYCDYALAGSAFRRVEVELEPAVRKELLRKLSPRWKARSILITLTAPIMDLAAFDPALAGGRAKSLRHAHHNFYRRHAVRVEDARACDKTKLKRIIDEWRVKRGARDRAQHARYYQMIDNDFRGMSAARVLVVDERAVGINAGWPIPNSNRFYAAIGIHDYSLPDLGAMLYLEDLAWLKDHGYKEADMGGSDKKLLQFKNQFSPWWYYKTHYFSLARQE